MFTNMFLHREQFGNTFVYDEESNVVSASARSGEKSNMEYDTFDNLISYVRPGAVTTEKYTMTYGLTDALKMRHLVRTVTTPEGVKSTNTYDGTDAVSKGLLIKTLNQKTPTDSVIGAKTGYSSSWNYATSAIDARGNTVTKAVNETTGLTTSVTDPANTTVNYTYDTSKRVTGVSCQADSKTYKNAYTYENDRIKTVSHNTTSDTTADVTYTFGYDSLGRKTTVAIGDQTLSTNVYSTDRSSLLKEVQYGNGGKAKYAYDDFDRLTKVAYDTANVDTNPLYTYEYGANGKLARIKASDESMVTYEYDLAERPLQTTYYDMAGNLSYRATLGYDEMNQLKSRKEYVAYSSSGVTYPTDYTYDKDGRPTELLFDGAHKVNYTYDNVGRVSGRKVSIWSREYAAAYEFAAGSTSNYGATATTPLVSKITQPGVGFEYAYDSRGNITSEKRGTLTTTYAYDGMGQLIRVNDPNDPTSGSTGTTWTYEYDRGGNMAAAKRYAYTTGTLGTILATTSHTYDDSNWKDKLTAVGGQGIDYDVIGNMTGYAGRTFQWEHGRRLRRVSFSGGAFEHYYYNIEGMRRSKGLTDANGNTVSTNYTYDGTRLTGYSHGVHGMRFYYDAQGRPAIVRYSDGTVGNYYAYVYNLQGDVVGILDNANNLVVEYKYDAWGKPFPATGTMAATLGKENPFRYRGYVYDEETGYYYLRSRFYDPGMRRFINADSSINETRFFLGGNVFCYCSNCPTCRLDSDGADDEYTIVIRMWCPYPYTSETHGHYDLCVMGDFTIGKTPAHDLVFSYGGGEGKKGKLSIFPVSDSRKRYGYYGSIYLYEYSFTVTSDDLDNFISNLTSVVDFSTDFDDNDDWYKFIVKKGVFSTYSIPGGTVCITAIYNMCKWLGDTSIYELSQGINTVGKPANPLFAGNIAPKIDSGEINLQFRRTYNVSKRATRFRNNSLYQLR